MDFDTFWQAYPSKKAKPVAKKAWDKINPTEHADILAGVERSKASRQWQEGYVPHPATFLNQRRWEDEHTSVVPGAVPDARPQQAPPRVERRQLTTAEIDEYLGVYRHKGETRDEAVARLGLDGTFDRMVKHDA